jgi:hypothetical protein
MNTDLLSLQHLILIDLAPHAQPNPPDYIAFSRTEQVVTHRTQNIKSRLGALVIFQQNKGMLESELLYYQRCLVALAGELQEYIVISKTMPLPEIFIEFTWMNLYNLVYKIITDLLAHIDQHFMPYLDNNNPGNA